MSRRAVIIRESTDGRRKIAVDDDLQAELNTLLKGDIKLAKKFDYICRLILTNIRNNEVYDKEEIDDLSQGVTAMKFFKGGRNARIYCKETTTDEGVFVVICCEYLPKKKQQELRQAERNIIHRVANYQFTEFYTLD